MVLLVITTRILSAIESIPPSSREELSLPSFPVLEGPISHEQLIEIARYFRESRREQGNAAVDHENDQHTQPESPSPSPLPSPTQCFTLNELLRGTKVYIPPPPKKPEPSPEYLAQKARLLAALQTDEYNRLISPGRNPAIGPSPIFSSSTPTASALHGSAYAGADTLNGLDSEDPLTPSLVLNIFLSVLITGFSVYWALTFFPTPDFLSTFLSSAPASEPMRVLLSLFAALGIGVAEVFIYAFYLKKVSRARIRERRIKEKKELVGVVREESDTDGAKVAAQKGEKEEIWGRGINGGVRRRVREKWEEKERNRNRHD